MKTKVKLGLVGAGWIIENAHIPALMKIEDASIEAVFDVDINRAEHLCTKFGIKHAYDNYDEFLKQDMDAVLIATPNFSHGDYSLKAVKHGLHVLCEKPVALHTSEVEEIMKYAKEQNILYIPGFVNRWREDIQKVYQMVKDDEIGEIKHIDAGWLRKCGVPRPGTWFTNRALAGGGVLLDLGSHVIDLCLMFMGDKMPNHYELLTSLYNPKKMEHQSAAQWFKADYANDMVTDVEDTAYAYISYEDETDIHVKLSWLASIDGDCTYFKLVGSKGSIKLKTLFGFSKEYLWSNDSIEVTIGNDKRIIPLSKETNHSKFAFEDMLRYYIQAVQEKKCSFTSSCDAKKSVEVIESLYQVEKVDPKAIEDISLEEFVHE